MQKRGAAMTTTNTEAPTEGTSLLNRSWHWWEKASAFLAIVALVDLTGQLIKWASIIHWLAEQYAAVRAWLFGWLPFHIPPEWHDPIVLLLILFSVTNVGLYRRTRRTLLYFLFFLGEDKETAELTQHISSRQFYFIWTSALAVAIIVTSYAFFFGNLIGLANQEKYPISVAIIIVIITSFILGANVLCYLVVAWRWVLTTTAIFGTLVAVNLAYVQWLEPLAEHH
jgi:hypothetical protein